MSLQSPSPWIEFGANGALADVLVEDFGRALMVATPSLIPPIDMVLCLETMEYGAAASVAVRIFFAEAAAAAAENQKEIVNVTDDYFIWSPVTVPRAPTGLPWTLRITKAATNANLGYRFTWKRPGNC
jgi:hypothetical protein